MKTEVNCLLSVWHQWVTAALWALIHSDYLSSQAISVNITLKCIWDVKPASSEKSIYDFLWSASKWSKYFMQLSVTAVLMTSNYFSFITSSLFLFWPSQKYYTLSLHRLALTVAGSRSKWEANGTGPHKMETLLGRQTLHCDSRYLITGRRKAQLRFPFFHTVSTLWESKYFSDYSPCALIHMEHSVCHHRCSTPRMFSFFFFFLNHSLTGSTHLPWATQWTHRGHTPYHTEASVNPLLNYPAILFSVTTLIWGLSFSFMQRIFRRDYALKIKGIYT